MDHGTASSPHPHHYRALLASEFRPRHFAFCIRTFCILHSAFLHFPSLQPRPITVIEPRHPPDAQEHAGLVDSDGGNGDETAGVRHRSMVDDAAVLVQAPLDRAATRGREMLDAAQ